MTAQLQQPKMGDMGMVSRFEQFSMAIASIHRNLQKIQRSEMAKFGLKGPHCQCLLALSRYPEGTTAAALLGQTDRIPTAAVSDDDIKFALFGGDGEITDAMYQEVKDFAALVKLREEMRRTKE